MACWSFCLSTTRRQSVKLVFLTSASVKRGWDVEMQAVVLPFQRPPSLRFPVLSMGGWQYLATGPCMPCCALSSCHFASICCEKRKWGRACVLPMMPRPSNSLTTLFFYCGTGRLFVTALPGMLRKFKASCHSVRVVVQNTWSFSPLACC